jgi:AcrR family transcriptional regulator
MATTRMKKTRTARPPAGAAVLQQKVTNAIRGATLAELARVGYARMSMESIARRAGVGKAAIYRRWATKSALVVTVIGAVTADDVEVPDTGTFRSDLRAVLGANAALLRRPITQRILADLMAETRRLPALEAALRSSVQDRRRAKGRDLLRRAIDRGELPADLDCDLALDLLAAPLYWRIVASRRPATPAYLDALTNMILSALNAREPKVRPSAS